MPIATTSSTSTSGNIQGINSSVPTQASKVSPVPIASMPTPFSFGGKVYVGVVTGFSDETPRRFVVIENLKRPGQRVEDFARGGRWLAVRMKFMGANCARDAQEFRSRVDRNPYGRLDHPNAGQWRAFCTGPSQRVELQRAIDLIEIDARFIEAELDAQVQATTPDVGTASQNVASQKTAYQQSVANVLGAYGKAQTQATNALNSIDAALDDVTAVVAPVALMQGVVNQALGAASKVTAKINNITSLVDLFNADIDAFVTFSVDLFTNSDLSPVGRFEAVTSTLDTVRTDAENLEDAMTTSKNDTLQALGGNAPAASAPAVDDIEIMVDDCMTLYDALLAQLPPIAVYVVPKTVNILVLSQRLMNLFQISGRAPEAYASSLLAINRSIPTPQAIPAGTPLDVPTA